MGGEQKAHEVCGAMVCFVCLLVALQADEFETVKPACVSYIGRLHVFGC